MISGTVTDMRLVCDVLARLAVDAQLHVEVCGVGDLVGGDDPRARRAEGVDALREAEHAGLHLLALDVARGDVVEDEVAGDVLLGLLGREELPRLADHDRELELVVQLVGHRLRIDDRVLGTDDRVDVLEEHDPRQHGMRPVDPRRLLVVLAEVARGVEELLRESAAPAAGPRPAPCAGRSPPPARRARSSGACRERRARSRRSSTTLPTRPSSYVTSFICSSLEVRSGCRGRGKPLAVRLRV